MQIQTAISCMFLAEKIRVTQLCISRNRAKKKRVVDVPSSICGLNAISSDVRSMSTTGNS